MLAGTPEDWVRWLTETYAPAGLNHALVSFARSSQGAVSRVDAPAATCNK
jgi:hypothetical protein